ncbi:hypothetical protein HDU98_000949 [Podochytrium sp. JEL0797]|nr:hypothetical protein HDU98_000949 [Podochytrium sp. JEL0797]
MLFANILVLATAFSCQVQAETLFTVPLNQPGYPYSGFSMGGKTENVDNRLVMTCLPPWNPSTNEAGREAIATSWDYLLYGSVEATIQQSTVGGIVTYLTLINHETHDEIDFEWIGDERTTVWTNMFYRGRRERYRIDLDEIWSSQVSTGPEDNAEIPHVYKIDWTPVAITWSVDGKVVHLQERVHTYEAANTGDMLPYDHYHYPDTPLTVNFGIWNYQIKTWANGPVDWASGKYENGFSASVWDIKVTPFTGPIPHYTDPLYVPTANVYENGPDTQVPPTSSFPEPTTPAVHTTTPIVEKHIPTTAVITTTASVEKLIPTTEAATTTASVEKPVPTTEKVATTTASVEKPVPTTEKVATTTASVEKPAPTTEKAVPTTRASTAAVPTDIIVEGSARSLMASVFISCAFLLV